MKRKVILYFFILTSATGLAQKRLSGYQVSAQANIKEWQTYVWVSDEINQLSVFDFFDPFLSHNSFTVMQQISYAINYELGICAMRWIDGHSHSHDFIDFRFYFHRQGQSYTPIIASKGSKFIPDKLPDGSWVFESWDEHSNQVLFRSWCVPEKLDVPAGDNPIHVAARILISPFCQLRAKH